MERYEFETKVGSGAFGTVWRAKNKKTGDLVAIKTLPTPKNTLSPAHIRVISLLQELKHSNVVRFLMWGISDGRMLFPEIDAPYQNSKAGKTLNPLVGSLFPSTDQLEANPEDRGKKKGVSGSDHETLRKDADCKKANIDGPDSFNEEETTLLQDLMESGYDQLEARLAVLCNRYSKSTKTSEKKSQKELELVRSQDVNGVESTIKPDKLDTVNPSFLEILQGRGKLSSTMVPLKVVPPPSTVGGNILIHIDEAEHQRRVMENRNSLLGKLYMPYGSINPSTLSLKKRMASLLGFDSFKLLLMGKGYFHIYLTKIEDRELLLKKGVLNLNPGSIRFTQWVPNFRPLKKNNTSAQVWVQIHDLPIEYWGENLSNIARGLGVLLRVDESQNHELFARMLIEVDFSKPLPKQLLIKDRENDFFAKVIYEKVPDFCEECKVLGHNRMGCRRLAKLAGTITMSKMDVHSKEQGNGGSQEIEANKDRQGDKNGKKIERKEDNNQHVDLIPDHEKRKDKENRVTEVSEVKDVKAQNSQDITITSNCDAELIGGGTSSNVEDKTAKAKAKVVENNIVEAGTGKDAMNCEKDKHATEVPLAKVWENLNEGIKVNSTTPTVDKHKKMYEALVATSSSSKSKQKKNTKRSSHKFPSKVSEEKYHALRKLGPAGGVFDSTTGLIFESAMTEKDKNKSSSSISGKWGDVTDSEEQQQEDEDSMDDDESYASMNYQKPLTRLQAERLKIEMMGMILDNFTVDGKMNLVLEYVPETLDDYIGHKYKNWRKPFLRDILEGVAHCHGLGIIHRDLKPKNILADPSTNPPTLKLGDFGGARGFINSDNTLTPKVGAIGYIAPEVHLGMSEYSMGVDMWAVGCIFYEMARYSPLFKPKSKDDELAVIFRLLGTPSEDTWPGVTLLPNYNSGIRKFPAKNLENQLSDLESDGVDLLQKMLSLDPSQRISAEDALHHPYFREEDSS